MREVSTRSTRRLLAVPGLVVVACLVGCGVGQPVPATGDASPAADVVVGEDAAAVSTPDERPPLDAPHAAAQAYAAFAVGGDGQDVPFAPQVVYRVGGVEVATLSAREAARPGRWRACPPAGSTYEGRACPVSPVRAVAQLERDGAAVQVDDGWPDAVGCTRVETSVAEGAAAVSLRPPPQRRDCFSDVGVLLQVDAGGRIDLVDLVLSGS